MSPDLRRSVDALAPPSPWPAWLRYAAIGALCALAWHYLTPGKPGPAPRPLTLRVAVSPPCLP